jgi:cation:H+ antiporter
VTYLLFFLGFVALVKGASLLVDGASSIARRLNVSDFVIGMTVVAFGTSTPELFVSLLAALHGNPDIAIGNIVGSNIANILLVLGVSALVRPLKASPGTVTREMPFALLASLALVFAAGDAFLDGAPEGTVARADGLLLLCFFAIFLYYSASIAKNLERMETLAPTPGYALSRSLLLVAAGLVGLTLGGTWIADGAVAIAHEFGMSEAVVGLTVVALGTSLPELATSTVAAWRGNPEIAVGNVLGSNILNVFFVLGVTAAVRPLPLHPGNLLDMGVMVGANLLLFAAMFLGKRLVLDRAEGGVLVAAYVVYLAVRVARIP